MHAMLALLKSEVDMKSALTQSVSDLIRDHLSETYLKAAKREGKRTFHSQRWRGA